MQQDQELLRDLVASLEEYSFRNRQLASERQLRASQEEETAGETEEGGDDANKNEGESPSVADKSEDAVKDDDVFEEGDILSDALHDQVPAAKGIVNQDESNGMEDNSAAEAQEVAPAVNTSESAAKETVKTLEEVIENGSQSLDNEIEAMDDALLETVTDVHEGLNLLGNHECIVEEEEEGSVLRAENRAVSGVDQQQLTSPDAEGMPIVQCL